MSYAAYLKEMLYPLGIYQWENSINGAELDAIGAQLDEISDHLEDSQKEMLLCTAENFGLDGIGTLLRRLPVAPDISHQRAALAALLRVGDDSFTLAGVNDTLVGCGLNAVASETDESGVVEVRFPEVPGIPVGFSSMAEMIEAVIPCHLLIRYVYWYVTWAMVENRFVTWGDMESQQYSWRNLEEMTWK